MDVNPSHVAIEQVQGHVERSFRPVAAQKGLGFEISIAEDMPPTIETDEQRLQQVLQEPALERVQVHRDGRRDAADRARATGHPVRVREPHPGTRHRRVLRVRLRHRDRRRQAAADLRGVPAGRRHHPRKYGGTGLGLSISREIARLLGGEIRAQLDRRRGLDVHAATCPRTTSRSSRAGPRVAELAAGDPVEAVEAPTHCRASPSRAFVPARVERRPGRGGRRRGRGGARPAGRPRRRPCLAPARRPRVPDDRGRRGAGPRWRSTWPRARLQGADRPARRGRPRARARVQARRDPAVAPAPDHRRRDHPRPPQAPPGDAPHPGPRDVRRRPPPGRRCARAPSATSTSPSAAEALAEALDAGRAPSSSGA